MHQLRRVHFDCSDSHHRYNLVKTMKKIDSQVHAASDRADLVFYSCGHSHEEPHQKDRQL